MPKIVESQTFRTWLANLRDKRAVMWIRARLDWLAYGLSGDAEPVGEGVSEARIHYGPGYRLYYLQRGAELIVMLAGGDKSTQQSDIKAAKRIAKDWRAQHG